VGCLSVTESSRGVNSVMDFRPTIHSSATDYSMHFDMTMIDGQGITELWITDDGSNLIDDVYDLHYSQASANLVSESNQIVPRGTCPEDGRVLYLFTLVVLGLAFRPLSVNLRKN